MFNRKTYYIQHKACGNKIGMEEDDRAVAEEKVNRAIYTCTTCSETITSASQVHIIRRADKKTTLTLLFLMSLVSAVPHHLTIGTQHDWWEAALALFISLYFLVLAFGEKLGMK